MDALLDSFADHQRARNLSWATIDAYNRVLRRWFEGVDALNATHRDVEAFLRGGPAHRKWLVSTLASWYRWAIREGHTDHDPTVRVERPKVPRRLPRPIAAPNLAVALRLAPIRIKLVLSLAAFAGLRCKEIAGLRWEDVWDDSLLVRETKGGNERVVPLHPYLAGVLSDYGRKAEGPVLENRHAPGQPIRRQRVSQMGNDFLRAIGVPDTMHQLRHFFGTETWRAMVDKDLLVLRDLMGHASTQMTEGYTKVVVGKAAVAAVHALPVPAVA